MSYEHSKVSAKTISVILEQEGGLDQGEDILFKLTRWIRSADLFRSHQVT
jgi:hypothetical protein